MGRTISFKRLNNALKICLVPLAAAVCPGQTPEQPEPPPPVVGGADPIAVAAAESEIRPRLELHLPSVGKLITETQRSHAGVFATRLGRMMLEMASASAEGVGAAEATAITRQIARWPDTAINAVTFAPDNEGRLRWVIRFDWPIQGLYERIQTLLQLESASELLEGLTLKSTATGGYEITLAESILGCLQPAGESHSYLASHPDLPFPTAPFRGTPETDQDGPPLLVCRLNLTGTEQDSGATFLSSFSMVTDVVYAGRVNEEGSWHEAVQVHWPPISGMGAKALFGRVKQTFFVPEDAFGALAVKSLMIPGMLEGMAGFGPQVMMEGSGEMAIVGEMGPGPIASSVGSEMCLTLLPGTGLLPIPDLVVQLKAKGAEGLIGDLQEAVEEINEIYRDRERPAPWKKATVRDRTVLWSEGTNQYPGMMMPAVMRPVLFATKETDARDRERDFLVMGWTSTSPKAFVRRWLDMPRVKEGRYLPQEKKTNGQLWINWEQVYGRISPYGNVALGSLVPDALLPRASDVVEDMTDGLVTVRAKYTGLDIAHRGPLPGGVLVVPALASASVAADESGGSDLARERLASQRLKVLYHHAKLFKKDMGRWPAEVAELDGYVDFAGHPELLKLQLSSRRQLSEWFEGLFKWDEDETDETDEADEIEDEVYVVDWGRESWRLGLAPNKLEHLEKLFIDQDGRIHRVIKVRNDEEDKTSATGESGEGSTG